MANLLEVPACFLIPFFFTGTSKCAGIFCACNTVLCRAYGRSSNCEQAIESHAYGLSSECEMGTEEMDEKFIEK